MSGLAFKRMFSSETPNHYLGAYDWEWSDITLPGDTEPTRVEFPTGWSVRARRIVAAKYFRMTELDGERGRETSFRQVIDRVATAIMIAGVEAGYYASETDARIHRDEIAALVMGQYMAFNSPVWFNVGIDSNPTVAACFLTPIEDSMESIQNHYVTEGRIYCGGAGNGTNYSQLRGSNEPTANGGTSSGPCAFITAHDAGGGSIKSGGGHRRAAKMVILDADHPDIVEFVGLKARAEEAAATLIAAGFESDFRLEHGAYAMVPNQNANHSVRVTDEFMRLATEEGSEDPNWSLTNRLDGGVAELLNARTLLRAIATAAHRCGDPGVQYHDEIQRWNPCSAVDQIRTSNPCSEFVFLDNTSCNLADFNVHKFFEQSWTEGWNVARFKHAVRTTTVAMDILIGMGGYPTEDLARMTRMTRPLGLGITNLGALLMALGLPYDSDQGRRLATKIVSLMSATGWLASAEMAEHLGAYDLFDTCRSRHLEVIDLHLDAARSRSLNVSWFDARRAGELHGYRNGQISVMAPSGTRSFLLDCDTTGIEPAFALQTVKLLVGGGQVETTLECVEAGLKTLGYDQKRTESLVDHVRETGTFPGSGLDAEDVPVFQVAVPPPGGGKPISWRGHLAMMESIQPFISGAQSKTINIPNSATVEDVVEIYTAAWRAGLKAVSIYRDGCKASQPLSTSAGSRADSSADATSIRPLELSSDDALDLRYGDRVAPEKERDSKTVKFEIGEHKGYLTVGFYPDGRVCEIFVRMAKEGSRLSGLLDSWATAVSLAIQHGCALETIVEKMIGRRFEPEGWTGERDIPYVHSVVDYIARFLKVRYCVSDGAASAPSEPPLRTVALGDGPICPDCRVPTVRNGTCHACPECGETTGCAG